MACWQPFSDAFEEYRRDESRTVGEAGSIAFPASEVEVRDLLAQVRAVAREAGTRPAPVTVQGARTGLAAGAVPRGGYVLNLSHMTRYLGLRQDERGRFLVRVEPGVVLSELRKHLARRALPFDAAALADPETASAARALETAPAQFFPTDPTETSACLGGMAACNASGARSYRYGPVRPHVEALRLVLPDGDVLALARGAVRAEGRRLSLRTEGGRELALDLPTYTMPRTKNASGYFVEDGMDAIDLVIGSDGTLGVITELELALMPVPAVTWGVNCFFAEEGAALDFTCAARPALGCATAFEYFDGAALDILRRQRAAGTAFSGLPEVPACARACVYVELACDDEDQAEAELERVGRLMAEVGADAGCTWVGRTDVDRERQRFFRHAVPESVNMLIDERRRTAPGITKLGSDMSVPDERLHDVVALYRRTLAEAGLESAAWGHIGDNHLHVNVLPRDEADYAAGKELFARWAEAVTAMGGAVSAEHGVGKMKRGFLATMYGERHVREMARLKLAFDPDAQLGRGNLFSEELLEEERARLMGEEAEATASASAATAAPAAAAAPTAPMTAPTAPAPAPVAEAPTTPAPNPQPPLTIVACVKAVPGSTEVKMDPVTHTIVRDGGSAVLNPFDTAALEVALRLAEDAPGSTVTALSMGIPDTVRLLRDCAARGATGAVLLSDRAFAGADTLATSYALTCGLARMERTPDLICCGKMAVDGDTAQIGPEIAAALGMPCVTDVREVLAREGDVLRVRCGTDAGVAVAEVRLPAVITCAREAAQLRMPSIEGALAAREASVEVLTAAAAGADPARCGLAGSPTQVVRSFVPEDARSAVAVMGTAAEQARTLVELVEEMGL